MAGSVAAEGVAAVVLEQLTLGQGHQLLRPRLLTVAVAITCKHFMR
jgi:hypothetical protein